MKPAVFYWPQLQTAKEFLEGVIKEPVKMVELPCLKCGHLFILPFAEGNEKAVLCEECNR
jgi:hypothetical protein